MDVSKVIYQLHGIHSMVTNDRPFEAREALIRLIENIDRDQKIAEIQHFAQVCSTEHAPMDLAKALRELADSFEPF
jgi:hypothetical protein